MHSNPWWHRATWLSGTQHKYFALIWWFIVSWLCFTLLSDTHTQVGTHRDREWERLSALTPNTSIDEMHRSSHSRPHILYSTDSKCHQKFATKTRPPRSDGAKFSVECYWRCWNRFAVMTFHLLSSLHNALLGHHLMAKDNVSKSTNRKILLLTMQNGYKSKFSYTSNNFCARERYFFGNFGMQYNNFFLFVCVCWTFGEASDRGILFRNVLMMKPTTITCTAFLCDNKNISWASELQLN